MTSPGFSTHHRVVVGAFALTAALCLFIRPAAPAQVAALLLAVATGMPHGALDGRVGLKVFEGRWTPFLFGYLSLAAAMLLLWQASATAGLALFLLLASWHFGEEERGSARVAIGVAPLAVTALTHGRELETLFATLAGPIGAKAIVAALAGPVALAWTGACVLAAARERSAAHAAEGVATVLLFAAAPPLVAFAVYFGVLHAPRALIGRARGDVPGALRAAVPLTLLALAGGVVLWAIDGARGGSGAVRAVFELLAALTLPHLWLDALAMRRAAPKCVSRVDRSATAPIGGRLSIRRPFP